ncbi:MAG TPA: PQQ-dependent sugar dehydrogenase [Acidimicrobiia bacterium]|nr:PQQ-dependent sugar dehydrogenase [Acidimicrobiia bacterium]
MRWRARGSGVALVAALVMASLAIGTNGASGSTAVPSTRAETLPAGFTDVLVATMDRPVALAPTPDGRILVVDQAGLVRVIDHGTLLPAPALNISAKVCATNSERGMLGIAVDPHFAKNGFVYLYYTFKKFAKCKNDIADVPVNRVARFTMTGDTIDPASEKVLIDGMKSFHGNHNAGDLGFGKDGMLYASVGDGGCDYRVGLTACEPDNPIAQSLDTLQGKVLRITPAGGIPKDNPFVGAGTARCNHGPVASGTICREIYLYGLRNPFRFAFDPNASGTRLFVDDTGEATWEEVDAASAGANFGWNVREGPCAQGSTTDCGPPPAGMTNPTFAYQHATTHCGAITGGAFVPDGLWAPAYDGSYLLGDYVCNRIYRIVPKRGGGWKSSVFARGIALGGPIAMRFAPYAQSTALYYTTYTTDSTHGQVRVIAPQ